MTKHSPGHSFFSSFSSYSSSVCSPSPIEDQHFSNENCTYSSGSHRFIDCLWDNAQNINSGCAIYFVLSSADSSASLNIKRCSFSHCHATGNVAGGGMHVQHINSVTLSESFFFDCSCGTYEYMEGGGVLLSYLHSQPLIKDCLFLQCVSSDDGGGCGIYYCSSSITYVVDSSRFIQCQGTDSSNSEGGGIHLCHNTDPVTCTNCLICGCNAPYEGGGAWIDYPSSTNTNLVTFCLFKDNTASSYGNDVILFNTEENTLTHCFTTTISDSVYVGTFNSVAKQYTNIHVVDWLPLGILGYST